MSGDSEGDTWSTPRRSGTWRPLTARGPSSHPAPTIYGAPAFTADAACASVDPELFFPTPGYQTQQRRAAKAICRACPVNQECVDYALASPHVPHGIWGGLDEAELAQMRSRMAATARAV